MKLWHLLPVEGLDPDPWKDPYERTRGFVIRAKTEFAARCMASESARLDVGQMDRYWLDPRYTTCTELTADGPTEIIMQDFYEQ